ncbi:MAG: hypothetical protein AB3N07_06325 [Ruegeria sp.]
MNRKYFHHSTQELEYEYRQHFGNLAKLRDLSEELKHRTRPLALDLRTRVSDRIASLRSRSNADGAIKQLLRQMQKNHKMADALEQTNRQLMAIRSRVETLETELEDEKRATAVDFDDIVSLKKSDSDNILSVSISDSDSSNFAKNIKVFHPDHSIAADLLGARVGSFIELDGRVRYKVVQISKMRGGFFVEMLDIE